MNVSHEQAAGDPAEKDGQQPQKKRRSARVTYPAVLLLLLVIMVLPRLATRGIITNIFG